MKKITFIKFLVLIFGSSVFAQLEFPRLSPKAELKQVIGDTSVTISYGRPNIRSRKIWGKLVPFGKVWRTGANEATVIEISRDVLVNDQKLPRGRYSLHTIPNENDWTIIFNKVWDQWGSFDYNETEDALRVSVKPGRGEKFIETLSLSFETVEVNSANVVIAWGNLRVPFRLDVGDVLGRTFQKSRGTLVSDPINSAEFVFAAQLKDKYPDAIQWLDNSIAISPSFAALSLKARIFAAMGKIEDAVRAGEKAVELAKAADPAKNTAAIERLLTEWRSKR